MRKILYTVFFLLLCVESFHAQEVLEDCLTSDTLQVYFRQDKIILEPLFRDNETRLLEFTDYFNRLRLNPLSNVRGLLIVSGASPEGTYSRNQYLSDNRADVVYKYLINNCLLDSLYPPLSHDFIEIESRGVDWKGLGHKVRASDLPYKNEVFDIISQPELITFGGRIVDKRKTRLLDFHEGEVWRELYDLYFSDLRGTKVIITYDTAAVFGIKPRPAPLLPLDTFSPSPYVYTDTIRKYIFAIETNLLFDAIVIPNIGAELAVFKGLTLNGNYQNIWLRDKNWTQWYRWEGFEAGINYYINKQKRAFKGHHLGIYGQAITWDFTINGRGYLAERWSYGIGLSYGYAITIGNHFNIDLEIGAGYLTGNMHEYIPQDGHRVWQSYEPFNWFGLTKAGVSLHYILGYKKMVERRIR